MKLTALFVLALFCILIETNSKAITEHSAGAVNLGENQKKTAECGGRIKFPVIRIRNGTRGGTGTNGGTGGTGTGTNGGTGTGTNGGTGTKKAALPGIESLPGFQEPLNMIKNIMNMTMG